MPYHQDLEIMQINNELIDLGYFNDMKPAKKPAGKNDRHLCKTCSILNENGYCSIQNKHKKHKSKACLSYKSR